MAARLRRAIPRAICGIVGRGKLQYNPHVLCNITARGKAPKAQHGASYDNPDVHFAPFLGVCALMQLSNLRHLMESYKDALLLEFMHDSAAGAPQGRR